MAPRPLLVCCCASLAALSACDSRVLNLSDAGVEAGRDRGAEVTPWGCTTSAQCVAREFCQIDGACFTQGNGQCRERPTSCAAYLSPVCGCDGQDYGNPCAAQMQGVNVAYAGKCTRKCDNLMYLPACAADEVCDLQGCGASQGTCAKKPDPLSCAASNGPLSCGCDGKTYLECERLIAGVGLDHTGPCAKGSVVIVTDKLEYASGAPVKAKLVNGTAASVFLEGCSAYSIERKENGAWANKGPTVVCGWEGIAKEVKASGSYDEELSMAKGGTYRVKAHFGVGCVPGKPLSAALCTSFADVISDPFVVLPSLKDCMDLQSKYAAAISVARTCDPKINTPQCLHDVLETLDCNCHTYVNDETPLKPVLQQWGDLGCSSLPGLPVCPPRACLPPAGAACASGVCKDLFI